MNRALVYGLLVIASFIAGIAIAVHKRDGRVSLRRVLFFDESVPKVFFQAIRAEGLRAFARLEIALFGLFFWLIALPFLGALIVAILNRE